jgi:hypothetical protein
LSVVVALVVVIVQETSLLVALVALVVLRLELRISQSAQVTP